MKRLISVGLLATLALAGFAQKYDPRFGESYEPVASNPRETNFGELRFRECQRVWLDMIGSAHDTLDLEMFYLRDEPGQSMEEVVRQLQAAARQGVKVRVVADQSYRETYPEGLAKLGATPNVTVRLLAVNSLSGGVLHAKWLLADGVNLFVGSQNFDWTALSHNRELGARVRDQRLGRCMAQLFELDWKLAEDPSAPLPRATEVVDAQHPVTLTLHGSIVDPGPTPVPGPGKEETVQVYPAFSPPQLTPIGLACEEEELVKIIGSAQQEVNLCVMTYSTAPGRSGGKPTHPSKQSPDSPYLTLDRALREAAGRGVKVKLLISDWGTAKPGIDALKALARLNNVEVKITTIPAFSGGFIPYSRVDHSKYLVVDHHYTWVGTSNWEQGYFHNSRDVSLIFRGELPNRQFRRAFEFEWQGPYAQPLEVGRDYPPLRKS